MPPLVSILIPCYNAERWVAQAIESALAQTWPEKEVIVVDDGSTDGSLDVIKRFDGRIRWETGPNRGGNIARNRLLELARGEWVQYVDADDYLLQDKVATQIRWLSGKPGVEVVYGPITLEYYLLENKREVLKVNDPSDPWILLARWFLPGTGSQVFNKQALLDIGGWKEDQPCCQEHELYLRLLMAGKRFEYCPNSGYIYRQWGTNTTSKRNIREIHIQRLEIERRLENYLQSQDELTAARQWAINQARFEVARMVWQYDSEMARKIVASALCTDPGFIPGGDAAPTLYRLLFRLLGFRLTETIADWRRQWSQPSARHQIVTDC